MLIERWGPESEEKPQEEGSSPAKSSFKLDASLAINGGNKSSETELDGGEDTVKEDEEEDEQNEEKVEVKDEEKVEEEEKVEDVEKVEGEGIGEGEKEQLGDIKKR